MIRILIIGAGKMGRAHIAAFSRLPDVEVVGVVSQSGESAKQLAAEFGVNRWGSNCQQVIEQTTPDACVVAVSHLMNEQITRSVINLGLHVLAEKPVALESLVVQELAHIAAAKGVIAMAAMNRRFYPSVSAAVDIARFYGPLAGVTLIAPDPVQPFRAQGLYDTRVYDHWTRMNTLHAIDLLRLSGGEIASMIIQSQMHLASGEKSTVASMRFDSGALGSYVSHGSTDGEWELRIHADGVEVQLCPLERGSVRVGRSTPRPLPDSGEQKGLKPGLRFQAQAFVEAVRDPGTLVPPASDLYDHSRSVALCEALESDQDLIPPRASGSAWAA